MSCPPSPRPPRGLALPLLLGACAGPAPAPAPATPDLMVVLVGGLRAPISDGPEPAPALLEAAFGDRPPGLRFEAAYAQSVSAWLSLGSALTGRHVSSLPLCSPPVGLGAPRPFCAALPAWAPTGAEVLGLYGYRAGLVVVDQPELGDLGRGFGAVIAEPDADLDASGEGWGAAVAAARAFWADPDPRPRLLVVVGRLDDRGRVEAERRLRLDAPATPDEVARLEAELPLLHDRLRAGEAFPLEGEAAEAAGRAALVAAAGDVGRALAPLLADVAPDDWVMLGGLYGLSLGEHDGSHTPEQLSVGAAQVLLERTLRVPLALRGPLPEGLPEAVDAPVELLDLVPTWAALAGAVPPAGLPGRDLLATARAPDADRATYAEFGDMLSLHLGRWRVVFRPQQHGITSANPELTTALRAALPPGATGGAGRTEDLDDFWRLHDVRADPLQAHDAPLDPAEGPFPRMARALYELRVGPAAPPTARLSAAEVDALRQKGALHYW